MMMQKLPRRSVHRGMMIQGRVMHRAALIAGSMRMHEPDQLALMMDSRIAVNAMNFEAAMKPFRASHYFFPFLAAAASLRLAL